MIAPDGQAVCTRPSAQPMCSCGVETPTRAIAIGTKPVRAPIIMRTESSP
jgi:hypothetical protein